MMFQFQRTQFIKDLFKAKGVLNAFDTIEFESVQTFVDAIVRETFYAKTGKTLEIPIYNEKEFLDMQKLIKDTDITNYNYITLLFFDKELLKKSFKIGLTNKKYGMCFVYDLNNIDFSVNQLNSTKVSTEWMSNNIFSIRFTINKNNYSNVLNKAIKLYNQKRFRFFDIKFDYLSLSQLKIKELEKFEFWINQFITWVHSSDDKNKLKNEQIEVKYKFDSANKKIFIDSNEKLYYNRQHFEESPDTFLFDIKKYYNSNGEQVANKDLNRFRQYLDFNNKTIGLPFIPTRFNGEWIDFYQNEKINKAINDVPLICVIIMNWFSTLNGGFVAR